MFPSFIFQIKEKLNSDEYTTRWKQTLTLRIILYQVSEQTESARYVFIFLQENNTVAQFDFAVTTKKISRF